MASERDLELLDDYLRNKLSAQDRSAFEETLRNDALLQKELRVQQQVVNSLRRARVAELKQMLNNVPITPIPAQTTGALLGKVAALVVTVALVGGGLYVYYNGENESSETVGVDTQRIAPEPSNTEKEAPAIESIPPFTAERDQTRDEQTEQGAQPLNEEPKTSAQKTTDSVAPAARNVFEPTDETKTTDHSVSADSNKGIAGVVSTPSIAIEAGINGNNGKYNFHYQFKDNKLFLYGVFEKNLYELMEFFSNNKRTLFLYYKDNYYLLNEEDNKVKRLTPISDQALIKKLKDYRSSR